ncbi:bacteriocin immunity protein [Streptococcus alactolyticus]|nr:bacteriocin immunity protein [Streptococcus alactolyticus]MCF2678019.1 bacteriocin immunity protein [Streptococcus alactolyticus]MDE2586908.1 bacteriocin immunity protein [Lactobacillales bacterium]
MFMNKRRKRKRQIFYHHIELVYNNPTLVISEELRQALLNSASGLEKGDSIAYLAYRLYPFVCDEVLHRKANRNDELLVLKKYLERKRWRYYWGVILQVAFTNH